MLSHLHQTNIHFTWLSWRWHRALLGAGAVLLFVLLLNMPLPALADVSVTNDQKALMELAEPYVSPTNGLGSWIWLNLEWIRERLFTDGDESLIAQKECVK